MLQIRIELESRSKLSIYLDNQVWKTLPRSLFGRAMQQLLHSQTLEELEMQFFAIEVQIGKRYAVALLAKKAHHSALLKKKLEEKGFSLASITTISQYCKELGALNDKEAFVAFLEKKISKGYSLHFAKLLATHRFSNADGVSQNTDMLKQLEQASAKKLLKKHFARFNPQNPKNLHRIYNFFLRRGYNKDFIYKMLYEIKHSD